MANFGSRKAACFTLAAEFDALLTGMGRLMIINTLIMHQHAGVRNIISMIAFDLEVIDSNRCLEDLVLDLLDYNVLPVDEHKNITGTELSCIRPTFYWGVERVSERSNNLLTIHKNMDQFCCLVDIGFNNFLECYIAGFLIPCPDAVAYFDFFLSRPCAAIFRRTRRVIGYYWSIELCLVRHPRLTTNHFLKPIT